LHGAEHGSRHLVHERREDIREAKVGYSDRQHAFLYLDQLQLDASVGIDGRDVGEARNLENEWEVGLAPLHVEHQTRGFAGGLRLGVVGRGRARRIVRALVEERDRPLVRAADLLVVARAAGAAESGRFVLDRDVRTRRVRKAVTEECAAGQGCRVDLQLEVPLVHPPVADVDAERQEEQDDRQQQRAEHEDAPVFT
jgi:hypothetical protein